VAIVLLVHFTLHKSFMCLLRAIPPPLQCFIGARQKNECVTTPSQNANSNNFSVHSLLSISPVKLKRPKRQNSQAKLASSTTMTGAAAAVVVSTEEQLHKMAKTSNQSQTAQNDGNGQLQQQHSQTDSTTSSSASSASSGGWK